MLDTGNSALYLGKQSGPGIYDAEPTFALELVEGALTSKPTIARLNVRDGRLFGSSKKRTAFIATGGQPTLTLKPKSAGAISAWMQGNDTPSGAGDPYTHVGIPPTALAAGNFAMLTGWQCDLGKWAVFHDMQIVGGDLEMSTDLGWARAKPSFIGMAKEQYLSVADAADLTLPDLEEETIHWVDGSGYHCLNGDWANMLHLALPTDLATQKTFLAAAKPIINAHFAVASGVHHKAADETNVLTFATPLADQAAVNAAYTEIRAALIAHEANTTVHYFADTTDNNPSAGWLAPTVTLANTNVAAMDLLGTEIKPGCYNRHLGAVANIRKVLWSFDLKAEPWQGTGLTAYTIIRKPGDIMVAVDQLQEDLRLINLAKFGTPTPATGDEVTANPVKLGFTCKLIANITGAERSLKIDVPEFDLDVAPLLDLTGNSEGNEAVVTIGGEATGTAPVSTITVVNDVATY